MGKRAKIVGQRPGVLDRVLLDEAKKLSPENSMTRLDTHGKYLFATVSVVGTLLTGLGVFSPSARTPTVWLLLPIALACVSLALAMMGITPRTAELNTQSLTDLRAHFNRQLRRRGRFITAAGITFALSLLSVGVVLLVSSHGGDPIASRSLRLSRKGDTTTLSSNIEMRSLPQTASIEAEVFGLTDGKDGERRTPLFLDITRPDTVGSLTVAAELTTVVPYDRYLLRARLTSDSMVLFHDSLIVPR